MIELIVDKVTLLIAIVVAIGFLFWKRRTNYTHKVVWEYGYALQNRKIEIVEDIDHCNRIVNNLQKYCKQFRVLGFDCEWVSVYGSRRPIALLQLGSPNGFCALIRLCKLKGIPMKLRKFLEDNSIIKVGVIPREDAMNLFMDYGVRISNTIDLRFLALYAHRTPEGIVKIARNVFGIEYKDWRVSASNWEAEMLTERQINYAANDVLVAIEAYKVYFKEIMARFNAQGHDEFLKIIKCFKDKPYIQNNEWLYYKDIQI